MTYFTCRCFFLPTQIHSCWLHRGDRQVPKRRFDHIRFVIISRWPLTWKARAASTGRLGLKQTRRRHHHRRPAWTRMWRGSFWHSPTGRKRRFLLLMHVARSTPFDRKTPTNRAKECDDSHSRRIPASSTEQLRLAMEANLSLSTSWCWQKASTKTSRRSKHRSTWCCSAYQERCGFHEGNQLGVFISDLIGPNITTERHKWSVTFFPSCSERVELANTQPDLGPRRPRKSPLLTIRTNISHGHHGSDTALNAKFWTPLPGGDYEANYPGADEDDTKVNQQDMMRYPAAHKGP